MRCVKQSLCGYVEGKVTWNVNHVMETLPSKIPARIYDGDDIVLFAKVKKDEEAKGTVEFTGKTAEKYADVVLWRQKVPRITKFKSVPI